LLRRAALSYWSVAADRRPKIARRHQTRRDALPLILNKNAEDAFYDRLLEGFNDSFLTSALSAHRTKFIYSYFNFKDSSVPKPT